MWRRDVPFRISYLHDFQVGAAIRPPTDFLLHIICRFRLVQWADQSGDGGSKHSTPFGKMEPEETGKIIVILAEEMLHLLIMILGELLIFSTVQSFRLHSSLILPTLLGERYHPGVGKCTFTEQMQREVIHVLCTGPQPFSHVCFCLPLKVELKTTSYVVLTDSKANVA